MKQILLLFVLMVSGGASAQSSEFIGTGLKLELGPAADFYNDLIVLPPIAAEIHAGDYNLFGPFGFREVISTDFASLELSGDLLFPLSKRPLFYLGVGAGLAAGNGTVLNLYGVGGVQLRLTSHFSFFTELNPGYYIASGLGGSSSSSEANAFGVKLRFGYNIHP